MPMSAEARALARAKKAQASGKAFAARGAKNKSLVAALVGSAVVDNTTTPAPTTTLAIFDPPPSATQLLEERRAKDQATQDLRTARRRARRDEREELEERAAEEAQQAEDAKKKRAQDEELRVERAAYEAWGGDERLKCERALEREARGQRRDVLDEAIKEGKARALAECRRVAASCEDCVDCDFMLGGFCPEHDSMLQELELKEAMMAHDALRAPEEVEEAERSAAAETALMLRDASPFDMMLDNMGFVRNESVVLPQFLGGLPCAPPRQKRRLSNMLTPKLFKKACCSWQKGK